MNIELFWAAKGVYAGLISQWCTLNRTAAQWASFSSANSNRKPGCLAREWKISVKRGQTQNVRIISLGFKFCSQLDNDEASFLSL